MAHTSGQPPIETAVLRQAAEWFAVLRCEDATGDDHARWDAWLRADAEHRRAWARIEAVEGRLRALPPEPARAALSAGGAERRRVLKGIAALAVGAPALWTTWRVAPVREWRADYRTAVGEIRKVDLSDGTRVWLNTASAMNVHYSGHARRLSLISGEVLIETAQGGDPRARPFILQTAAGSVRPVWTRFSARERGDIVRVSVYRGVVTVEPMANAAGAELVAAGRMTRFSATRVEPPRPLPDQSAAWTRGVLLADGMRLGHFLDELSRYHAGYLTYAPEVAQLRLVGSYPLTDPNRVLKALEASLPVRVRRFTPWWIRVEPR